MTPHTPVRPGVPRRRESQMYEYHVMGVSGMSAVQNELTRRSAEGWELVTAYQEVGGGNRHVLILKRALEPSAPR
jgi:hypothetical protein